MQAYHLRVASALLLLCHAPPASRPPHKDVSDSWSADRRKTNVRASRLSRAQAMKVLGNATAGRPPQQAHHRCNVVATRTCVCINVLKCTHNVCIPDVSVDQQ